MVSTSRSFTVEVITYGENYLHIGVEGERFATGGPKNASWATSLITQDGRPDRWVTLGAVMTHRYVMDPVFKAASMYDGSGIYCGGRLFLTPGWNIGTPVKDELETSTHQRWVRNPATNTWSRQAYEPQSGVAAVRTGAKKIRMGVSSAFVVGIATEGTTSSIAVVNRATAGVHVLNRAERITAGPLIRGTRLLYYANDPGAAGHTRRVLVDLTTMAVTVERSDEHLIVTAATAPSYLTDIPRLTDTGVLLMDDDQVDLGLAHDGTETQDVPAVSPFGFSLGTSGSELKRTTLGLSSNYILATTIPDTSVTLQRSAIYVPVTEGGAVRAVLWTGDTELDFGAHRSRGHFS